MPREGGLSSGPACAEPDNRCADARTANKFATPLVFGDQGTYGLKRLSRSVMIAGHAGSEIRLGAWPQSA
jgi:hypothetical protein